jgi:hypothetical protein
MSQAAFASPAGPSGSEPAPTSCRIRVNASPSAWIIRGYDPFGSAPAGDIFGVTLTNDSQVQCSFAPVFRLEQPPFGLARATGKPIRYTIENLIDSQDVTPRTGSSQHWAVQRDISLGPNETRTLLFRLSAAADDVKEAGTFTQEVTLDAEDSQLTAVGSARLVLGLEVLPSARIGLAGAYSMSNGRAVVDLGELRQGPAPVPLQIRVNSTGRYSLSIASENAGRLRLGTSDWYVPYSLSIGGMNVNLSGTDTLAGPNGAGLTRDALPMHFVIDDVAGRRAGTYSDVISVSVAAR